jgi:hypothetical protein
MEDQWTSTENLGREKSDEYAGTRARDTPL